MTCTGASPMRHIRDSRGGIGLSLSTTRMASSANVCRWRKCTHLSTASGAAKVITIAMTEGSVFTLDTGFSARDQEVRETFIRAGAASTETSLAASARTGSLNTNPHGDDSCYLSHHPVAPIPDRGRAGRCDTRRV